MKKNFIVVAALLSCGAATAEVQAGFGVKAEEKRQQKSGLIGQTIWIYFGDPACKYTTPPQITKSTNRDDNEYYSSGFPVKLYIQDEVGSGYYQYYKVIIDDKTDGYINSMINRINVIPAVFLFTARDVANQCIMHLSPDERSRLIEKKNEAVAASAAAQRMKQEADKQQAAILASKPYVKIGMTTKQVRDDTNWGEPAHINRTVTGRDVIEQWVYSEKHILRFKNGHLDTIQD